MAAAAPAWAAQFSWSAVADRIESVYDEVARGASHYGELRTRD
jgi:hypothetical protein